MSEPSKRDNMRGLMAELIQRGLTDYGSNIPTELVHRALGITMPKFGTKETFDGIALVELAAIDYCRNVLMSEGKYLQGTRTGYRILLPSENRGQIDRYMSSADNKLSRALKLSRNTPAQAQENSQTEARIMLKQSSARRSYHQPSAMSMLG